MAGYDTWYAIFFVSVLGLSCATVYVIYLNRDLRRAKAGLEREVADRLKTQRQLAENEDRLRQIIATEPECVKIQDRDGTILEMNPAGLKLVEAAHPDDMIGVSVYAVVAPESREAYESLSARVFAGESEILEFEILSFKGRRRWMETHAAPLRDAEGGVVALLGITRDISARKRYEAKIRRECQEFAHASRLDTMAQMATTLAHELNQPLTAIANYSRGGLLRLRANGKASDEVVEAMENVCFQAERAANMVRSLRSYIAKGEGEQVPLGLNEVIEEALAIAELEARGHNVRIATNLADDLPQVLGDPTQLEQVILNILRNGVDALADVPASERVLRIETDATLRGTVRTRICDCGLACETSNVEVLFRPFFSTKADGLGLGLPISRSIAEAHGGRLVAFSNAPEPGLTFAFELPSTEGGHA